MKQRKTRAIFSSYCYDLIVFFFKLHCFISFEKTIRLHAFC